jgi:hypothetical protein
MTAPDEPQMLAQVARVWDRPGYRRRRRARIMIACCIPVLLTVAALVATGVASLGFLVIAIGWTLMMAIMMTGMGHRGNDRT